MMLPLISLLQTAPAETTKYMIAGYAVIFLVLGLYITSLVVRNRKLRQELDLLQEIEPADRSALSQSQ